MMYNFRSYLLDMRVWENLHFKTRKSFQTALAVMYGKKKDRSGLRKKISKIRDDYYKESCIISQTINKVSPSLGYFLNTYGSYGGY